MKKLPAFYILPIWLDGFTEYKLHTYGMLFIESQKRQEVAKKFGGLPESANTFCSILQAHTLALCQRKNCAEALISLFDGYSEFLGEYGFTKTSEERPVLLHDGLLTSKTRSIRYMTTEELTGISSTENQAVRQEELRRMAWPAESVTDAFKQYMANCFYMLQCHHLYDANGLLQYELCHELLPAHELSMMALVEKSVAQERRKQNKEISDAFRLPGPIRAIS
jgi:hypothetical protein